MNEQRRGSDALRKLRSHEFDLPRYLAEQGLQGIREDCYLCPIARYLLRETDAVDVETNVYNSVLTYADGSVEYAEHPVFVWEFIQGFDKSEFPELELRVTA